MPTFIASRISADHNVLFPDRIDVEEDRVVYYKGSLIGYQSTVIPRASISSVRINSNILFADIISDIILNIKINIYYIKKIRLKNLS